MFCCRELLFSKLFYRHQQQPPLPVLRAAAGNRNFFSRISDDTLGSFFVWFWTLLVLQSHGVLLPGAAFFEAVLPASAAAAAASSSASSRRQQNLSTNAVFLVDFFCRQSVDKCCFLFFLVVFLLLLYFFQRFPDDTLGSFFACFWTLLVLHSHGVLLPGATFFEAVLPASAAAAAATSSASSRKQQNLSTISRQCAKQPIHSSPDVCSILFQSIDVHWIK